MAEIVTKERVPYRIWDKVNSKWNELKFKTNANSVDANDGDNMETKVGAIKGITTSTEVTEEGYAADATTVAALNSSLGVDIKLIDGVPNWSPRGADTFVPFSSVVVGQGTSGNIHKGITVEVGRKVNNIILITGQSKTYANYKATTFVITNNTLTIARSYSGNGGFKEDVNLASFEITDKSFTVKYNLSDGFDNAPYYYCAW